MFADAVDDNSNPSSRNRTVVGCRTWMERLGDDCTAVSSSTIGTDSALSDRRHTATD